MSKIDTLNNMQQIMTEMRPLLVEARIHPTMLTMPEITDIRGENYRDILEASAWLKAIFSGAYRELVKIKQSLPDDVWRNQKSFGFSDLPEFQLLLKCQKAVRKNWYLTRPPFFSRKLRKKHGKSSSKN